MDSILIQKDLYVGVPELNSIVNNQKKYAESIVKSVISNFGFVKNALDTSFLNLKIIAGSSANTVTLKAGTLIDANLKQIILTQDVIDIYTVPNDSSDHYLTIASNSIVIENGTVDITTSGELTGTNTEFTKFRVGNYATKIMFISGGNTGQYEISNVTSDTVAQLTGSNFTAGTGLGYKIVGTFSQGITATNPNLYYYDSYIIADTTSAPTESDTLFLLAKVSFNGSLTITDLRTQFLQLNISAVYDYLSAANNLSDLINVVSARSNLGVYSIAEITSLLNDKLNAANNLSDIDSALIARSNLLVYSISETDALLALKAKIAQNSWVQMTSPEPTKWVNTFLKYRKDQFGNLVINGSSQNQDGSTAKIFTLPSGYLPPYDIRIVVADGVSGAVTAKLDTFGICTLDTTPTASRLYYFNLTLPLD